MKIHIIENIKLNNNYSINQTKLTIDNDLFTKFLKISNSHIKYGQYINILSINSIIVFEKNILIIRLNNLSNNPRDIIDLIELEYNIRENFKNNYINFELFSVDYLGKLNKPENNYLKVDLEKFDNWKITKKAIYNLLSLNDYNKSYLIKIEYSSDITLNLTEMVYINLLTETVLINTTSFSIDSLDFTIDYLLKKLYLYLDDRFNYNI